MICNVFTEVAHTSQYRVSSYDSFYSKFNEGSWVGEGRGETVPTPIPQFQKTFQEMSQTLREERTDPSSAQREKAPQVPRSSSRYSTCFRSWGGGRHQAVVACDGTNMPGECSLYHTISCKGGPSEDRVCSLCSSLWVTKGLLFFLNDLGCDKPLGPQRPPGSQRMCPADCALPRQWLLSVTWRQEEQQGAPDLLSSSCCL